MEPLVTVPNFRELSSLLENVARDILILNEESSIVKFQEIFIDINNKLNDIHQTDERTGHPIFHLLNGFDAKLVKLNAYRKNPTDFMNFCLDFAFLLYTLNDLYPNGCYINEFKLDNEDAEKWWNTNFGLLIFVEVSKFWKAFSKRFPNLKDINCVLKSICFTQLEWFPMINKASFNIFLRYYGDWKNLELFWIGIFHHPGMMHMNSLESSIKELESVKTQLKALRKIEKSYLFCLNWRDISGSWYVIYGKDNEIATEEVRSTELLTVLQDNRKYKYPRGIDISNPATQSRINSLLKVTPAPSTRTSKIEENVYDTVDSTKTRPESQMNSDYFFDLDDIQNKTCIHEDLCKEVLQLSLHDIPSD